MNSIKLGCFAILMTAGTTHAYEFCKDGDAACKAALHKLASEQYKSGFSAACESANRQSPNTFQVDQGGEGTLACKMIWGVSVPWGKQTGSGNTAATEGVATVIGGFSDLQNVNDPCYGNCGTFGINGGVQKPTEYWQQHIEGATGVGVQGGAGTNGGIGGGLNYPPFGFSDVYRKNASPANKLQLDLGGQSGYDDTIGNIGIGGN